jgi:hypothetical protein
MIGIIHPLSGTNPMIVSYNAASSQVRFDDKNIFIYFDKTL